MLQRRLVPVVAGLTLISLGALGCTDDSGSDEGSDEVGETATTDDTTTDTGDTTETSDTGTTEESTDDTTEETTEDESTEETTEPPACEVWEITYNLEGSSFDLTNVPLIGEASYPVMAPYEAPATVGPGAVVIRFQDVDGAPGGVATVVSYEMDMNFESGIDNAVVTTDLQNRAGPEDCGVTSGPLEGMTAPWTPGALVGHHSVGTIVCNGFLCGAGGFEDGVPENVDETSDMPLGDFTFSGDFSSFTAPSTEVPNDDAATTHWVFTGSEVSRELVGAPECLCP